MLCRCVGAGVLMKVLIEAKNKPPLSEIERILSFLRKSDQWTKDNGQFIPNPQTWIDQARWDDEIMQEVKSEIWQKL